MNIPKAIEILRLLIKQSKGVLHPDTTVALKLGIEALKFRLRLENAATKLPYRPLPGETKD